MKLQIINKNERKEILKKLRDQYGIEKVDGIFVRKGEERLFLFQGDLSEKELLKFQDKIYIEKAGIYFAKFFAPTGEIRLSIEGTWIFRDQIKKNIFELDSEQAKKWMEGQELLINSGKKGFLVMTYGNYFLGCGKASKDKIGNFVPKNRRLKIKSE